jgi:hypothetical protein
MQDSLIAMMMGLIPIFVLAAITLCVVSFLTGGHDVDENGLGGGFFSRWWWIFLLMGLPIFIMAAIGVGLVSFLGMIIVFTIIGAIVLFIFEHGIECPEIPKGDPLKNMWKVLKEKFRW